MLKVCVIKPMIHIYYLLEFFLFPILDAEQLILPPARQPAGPNKDLRVIGHYSETNVKVGCGPTHPSVNVILKKFDDEIKVTTANNIQMFLLNYENMCP